MSGDLATLARLRAVTSVEVACGAGAGDGRCREGPVAFRKSSASVLRSRGIALDWRRMPADLCALDADPLQVVSRTARWTAGVTRRLTASGDRFVVVGGDHSCAIGTWSGVSDALRNRGALGLVWIDAHMDMHVPETTHSGAIHGMPVACLLGHGEPLLTSIAEGGPALDPRHVCLIGARSFEVEEVAFAERLGVRVIGMEEVHRRGVEAVLAEAHAVVTRGTVGFGVSLDLDVFDPSEAPGVGTPAPDGVRAAAFLPSWSEMTRDSRCVGLEIVEYNPARDKFRRTEQLMFDLIAGAV
ncbi:arginase [Bradyrhizobium sp. WD16]|uniref:arginase n=1 Tax=Bradyrhizobium sp. WD16 TaxID=1521768 RepID=UPI0020A61950|nr:arginase [Bradyrhizobium sp. WD16]UTD29765.1 arginase [Bradyrhizobium sp. WD16]